MKSPSPLRLAVRLVCGFLFGALAGAPLLAVTITGTVTNGTTHKPAAGDAVVLIALDQRMQEISRTTTDGRGHFSIDSPDPGMHLIRVDHQRAAYFQPAPPNTPNVDLTIYDVAETVPGVSTEADVTRIEASQQDLHVTRSIFVKNDSKPPRTQFSKHSYEFYLPPGAEIEGSAAMGPGGMPVRSSPVPLSEKGRYAFLFPLRPGETQFQITYQLPYSGKLEISPRLVTPAANLVVMLPKSMGFVPGAKSPFQSLDEDPSAQTFLARNVSTSAPLAFTISGYGSMPRDDQAGAGQPGAGQPDAGQTNANGGGVASGAESASTDTRPGGGLGVPIDTPDPLNKYKWWILGGLFLAMTAGAGFLLRRPVDAATPAPLPATSALPAASAPRAGASGNHLLAALKEELFALETERVQGKLSDGEYSELKQALELVLRRALSRSA